MRICCKQYRYIFVALVVWIMAGCSKDVIHTDITGCGKTAQVQLEFATRAATSSNEDLIQTVRIYAFRKVAASTTYELVAYHYADFTKPSGQTGTQQPANTVTVTVPTDKIVFYFIVNEAAAGELKLANTTPVDASYLGPLNIDNGFDLSQIRIGYDQFKDLTFSKLPEAKEITPYATKPVNPDDQTGRVYESPILPMTSVMHEVILKDSKFTVQLVRSVAKMELYFSKTGSGELYMGRGVYLYNEPQFGYLFPRQETDAEFSKIAIGRKEDVYKAEYHTTMKTNPDYNDSFLHQLRGRVLLSSGFPDEVQGYDGTTDHSHASKLDINQVTVDYNNPETIVKYQKIPDKSYYLFASPYVISRNKPTILHTTPQKPQRFPAAEQGYYLKVLSHQHLTSSAGIDNNHCDIFYLSLPQVNANDYIRVNSLFSLSGYNSVTPGWIVEEWKTGGGDIVFN